MRDNPVDKAMSDKPQEGFDVPDRSDKELVDMMTGKQDKAISHARRVTAEYAGVMIADVEYGKGVYKSSYRLNGKYIQWNPDKDYNQLMMVVEKALKSKYLGVLHISYMPSHDKFYVAYEGFHETHEKKIIAILLCISKAIQSFKK